MNYPPLSQQTFTTQVREREIKSKKALDVGDGLKRAMHARGVYMVRGRESKRCVLRREKG